MFIGQLISGERLQDHWSSGFFLSATKQSFTLILFLRRCEISLPLCGNKLVSASSSTLWFGVAQQGTVKDTCLCGGCASTGLFLAATSCEVALEA